MEQELLEGIEIYPVDELSKYGRKAHDVRADDFIAYLQRNTKSDLASRLARAVVNYEKAFLLGENMELATKKLSSVFESVSRELKWLDDYYNSLTKSEKLHIIRAFARNQEGAMTGLKSKFMALVKSRVNEPISVLMPSYYDGLIALYQIIQVADYDDAELLVNEAIGHAAALVCYVLRDTDENTITWLHADLISRVRLPPTGYSPEMKRASETLLNLASISFE